MTLNAENQLNEASKTSTMNFNSPIKRFRSLASGERKLAKMDKEEDARNLLVNKECKITTYTIPKKRHRYPE